MVILRAAYFGLSVERLDTDISTTTTFIYSNP